MMPKPDAELEIDPDPRLDREANEAVKEAWNDKYGTGDWKFG